MAGRQYKKVAGFLLTQAWRRQRSGRRGEKCQCPCFESVTELSLSPPNKKKKKEGIWEACVQCMHAAGMVWESVHA